MLKCRNDLTEEEFCSFKHGYLLQDYDWAKVKDNWRPIYTGVERDGKLAATALGLIKD